MTEVKQGGKEGGGCDDDGGISPVALPQTLTQPPSSVEVKGQADPALAPEGESDREEAEEGSLEGLRSPEEGTSGSAPPTTAGRSPFVWNFPSRRRNPNESGPFPIPIREFFGLGPRVNNTGIERFANMSGSMLLEYTDYLTGRTADRNVERERLTWREQDEAHVVIPMVAGASGSNNAPSTSTGGSGQSSGRPRPNPTHRASGESVDLGSGQGSGGTYTGGGTAGGSHRESLVLDIESGLNGWELNNTANNGSGGDGDPANSNRRQGDRSGTNSPTPGESAEGSPTHGTGDRSPAEILRDSPETRAVINEINRYTTVRPFLIIMILKGLIDHGSGIVCFLAMLVTFSHSNSLLKKEVSKQRKRNLLFLAMITINLIVCASFMYYVFSDEELYYAMIFMPTKVEPSSFWILMWVVGITDHVAKFLAVISKAVIVSLPPGVLPFQKRGKYYLFIEQSSQLYRSFLPIPHWFTYLLLSYEGGAKMFGMILAGMYVMFKAQDSIQRFKDWHSAFTKLLQNVHYGTTPTSKEMDETGPNCPICHDSFSSPTRLSCTHIFCEECVATWFDRERTCPMCRAKVVDDPSFRDGSTAMYIQLF